MADGIFNVALGAAKQLVSDNADSVVVLLLKAADSDDDLADWDTVAAMLGDAANTEADFTNYARKTGLTESVTVDDAASRVDVDIDDQTWTSAGGASNNTLVKLIVAVQTGGSDSTLIPLTHHDFPVTTDSSDLTAQFAASGFYRAS